VRSRDRESVSGPNKEGCVPNDKGRTSTRATTEALARQFEGKARDALATLEKLGDTDWKVAPSKLRDSGAVHDGRRMEA